MCGFSGISISNRLADAENRDKLLAVGIRQLVVYRTNAQISGATLPRPTAFVCFVASGIFLSITAYYSSKKDWNYQLRQYRPRKEILDGTWQVPEPVEVK